MDGKGNCLGFAKSKVNDEPIEQCKLCCFCSSADEDLTEGSINDRKNG